VKERRRRAVVVTKFMRRKIRKELVCASFFFQFPILFLSRLWGTSVFKRSIFLIAALVVVVAAIWRVSYLNEAHQHERIRWNCISDAQLARAQTALYRANRLIEQKNNLAAFNLLKAAISALPYRYPSPDLRDSQGHRILIHDDTGLTLFVADGEEKDGKLNESASERRGVLQSRIDASETPKAGGCIPNKDS
jgi:hypothetical protein